MPTAVADEKQRREEQHREDRGRQGGEGGGAGDDDPGAERDQTGGEQPDAHAQLPHRTFPGRAVDLPSAPDIGTRM